MNPLKLNSNNSTIWLLPMLNEKGFKHNDIINEYFINAYIADIDKPENDNKLLIKYFVVEGIPKFFNEDNKYTIYLDESDDSFVVAVNIPEEHLSNYHKFLAGQYSKFSKEYKQLILQFWEEDESTLLYGILHKTGRAEKMFEEMSDIPLDMLSSDMEYWYTPKMDKEILGLMLQDFFYPVVQVWEQLN